MPSITCLTLSPKRRTDPEERFWKKVAIAGPDDCWEWLAGKSHGYGRYGYSKGNVFGAHVVSWLFANKPSNVPPEHHVCHRCDNPGCVNPKHLFVGTNGDNGRDMWRKGRAKPGKSYGTDHGLAKLNPTKVVSIRHLSNAGFEQRDIAARYAIHQSTVWSVVNRHTWAQVA